MSTKSERSEAARLLGAKGGLARAKSVPKEQRQAEMRASLAKRTRPDGTPFLKALRDDRKSEVFEAGRGAGHALADQFLEMAKRAGPLPTSIMAAKPVEIKKPSAETLDREVYDVIAVAGAWTGPEVQRATGLSDLQVRSAFSRLRDKGFIERDGERDGRAAYRVKA